MGGCPLYKIDILRAFRHRKVDPLDYDPLGLSWHNIYVDTCVAFGSRHGSQIFQRCSDTICFNMRKNGHKLVAYIDNYIGFGARFNAKGSFHFLYDLLIRLGLTISKKKLVRPGTKVTCLGVEIDTLLDLCQSIKTK